jgi:glutathione S-transferase
MKLYGDPISTTCRPIMLLAAESGADLKLELVDLFKGAHMQPDFAKVNPSRQVPVLDDDGFTLSESSAILKYLADKIGSPAYPKDLKKRAKVNEMMDWFNTGLYRDFGYGFIYAQVFPHQKREGEAAQAAQLAFAREKAKTWLKILDESLIGPKKKFLCGDEVTIADYFGGCLLNAGEIVRCDFKPWPNVSRWMANMRALPNWGRVHEQFYTRLVGPMKDAPFAAF